MLIILWGRFPRYPVALYMHMPIALYEKQLNRKTEHNVAFDCIQISHHGFSCFISKRKKAKGLQKVHR